MANDTVADGTEAGEVYEQALLKQGWPLVIQYAKAVADLLVKLLSSGPLRHDISIHKTILTHHQTLQLIKQRLVGP